MNEALSADQQAFLDALVSRYVSHQPVSVREEIVERISDVYRLTTGDNIGPCGKMRAALEAYEAIRGSASTPVIAGRHPYAAGEEDAGSEGMPCENLPCANRTSSVWLTADEWATIWRNRDKHAWHVICDKKLGKALCQSCATLEAPRVAGDAFQSHVDSASKVVSSWPIWKQQALGPIEPQTDKAPCPKCNGTGRYRAVFAGPGKPVEYKTCPCQITPTDKK